MGNNQSARSAHFQPRSNPDRNVIPSDDHEAVEEHISISNKMVERLVEDATIGGVVKPETKRPVPYGDEKDQINIEKLMSLDNKHSERHELTVADVDVLAKRIDARTANIAVADPVCDECMDRVLSCYGNCDNNEDLLLCWEAVIDFKQCVNNEAFTRLRARTAREAREHARRSRHVALAREHALKDLGPKSAED